MPTDRKKSPLRWVKVLFVRAPIYGVLLILQVLGEWAEYRAIPWVDQKIGD